MRAIAIGIILAIWCVQPVSAGIFYTLVSDSPQFDASPFGFSGTITTDGSTGLFSDVSFITDWSITLETPGNVDGIFTETLTPADGPFTFFQSGVGFIEVSTTEITIRQSQEDLFSLLRLGDFGAGGTNLSIQGPDRDDLGLIFIRDNDNSPTAAAGEFGTGSALQVATSVPEPSAFMFLSLVGLVGVGTRWWRNRRTRI